MGIDVNGTDLAADADVYFNGTKLDYGKKVYFNGTEVFRIIPYPPGTEMFTYSVSAGGNISNLVTTYASTYPQVFETAPYYIEGSGSPDSRVRFKLANGYRVSYYSQAGLGTDSDGSGAGNTNGVYTLYVGYTVSGLGDSTYGFSIAGSGNGGTTFKVIFDGTYV